MTDEMPIELIEHLGKHGVIGLAAAAVLYLASKAIERGFSLTINAPRSDRTKNQPTAGPKAPAPRLNEPRRLPPGRRRKGRRARRRCRR
jgi:hypothetical protein